MQTPSVFGGVALGGFFVQPEIWVRKVAEWDILIPPNDFETKLGNFTPQKIQ